VKRSIVILIISLSLALLCKASDNDFAGGDGTQESPWQIKTAIQLDNVRKNLSTTEMKYFKLMNDIDLKDLGVNNNWMPYADGSKASGAYMDFNGNGYVIKNMHIERFSENPAVPNYQSFAGVLWGKIQNLGLVNVYINCPTVGGIGAFVGYAGSATPSDNDFKTGVIENCYATGYVSGGGGTVGGVAGTIGRPSDNGVMSYIKNCYFSGELYNVYKGSSTTVRTGGIAGIVYANENVPPTEPDTLTIVSYNLYHFGNNPAYPNGNYLPISKFLQSLNPDVVVLQELDSVTTRSKGVYQLHQLSYLLSGWDYRFAGNILYQGGSYGIGTITPHPILQSSSYFLTSSSEQRGFLITEFDKYIVICTHLDLVAATAKIQAQEITAKVQELYGNSPKPVFLAGDLNSLPTSDTMTEFRKNWIQINPSGGFTIPANAPNRCIDYILMFNKGQNYKILQSQVITDSPVATMSVESDHLPVMATIEIY